MYRAAFGLLRILTLCIAFGLAPSYAADAVVAPASKITKSAPAAPLASKRASQRPDVAFGCKRVWRCDTQVCEWRRGCWGVYGYMEGPYYSLAFAQRQWERDGWPTPRSQR
jgi:hypothetical protein